MGAAMTRFATFATISCVLLWVPQALAQEPPHEQDQTESSQIQEIRVSVDFGGGTLNEYVSALRNAQSKQPINIVVTPEAEDLPVPPVNLIDVPIEAAVEMLEGKYPLPESGYASVDVDDYSRFGDPNHTLLKVAASRDARNVHTSVWSVTEEMEAGLPAEKILAAVEAVLSVFPYESNLKFHEATGLLILRGTEDQIAAVEEALERLHDGIAWRENQQEILHDQLAPLKSELQEAEIELREAQQVLHVTQLSLESAVEDHEEGLVSKEGVAMEELDVIKKEGRVMILEHRVQDLKSRINRLEAKLEGKRATNTP